MKGKHVVLLLFWPTHVLHAMEDVICVRRSKICAERSMTDLLTTVLRSLRLRIDLLGRFDLCGDWALDFGYLDKAAFHLAGRGPFWMHCSAYSEPLELNEGDVVFFPQPQWHQFSGTQERSAETRIVKPGEAQGPVNAIVCCAIEFESRSFNPVLSSLPPIMVGHCQDEFASAELAALTRLVLSEYDAATAGYEAMRERLAETLFIQLLRYYMRTATEFQGLVRALVDPQLALSLAAMHAEPGREWDVDQLAAQSNMSRSICPPLCRMYGYFPKALPVPVANAPCGPDAARIEKICCAGSRRARLQN
jgi:AraC family transcriptional regulator, activator of mtrCDE